MRESGADAWRAESPVPTGRCRFAAVWLDGKLYLIGGLRDGVRNEAYDPATGTYSSKADMPTSRSDAAAAAVGGKIYVIGGQSAALGGGTLGTVEEYDPTANTWRPMADMPTARHSLALAQVGGKIYAAGGFAAQTNGSGLIACQSPAFGYQTLVSPDGLNWSQYSQQPIAPW